MSKTSTVIKSGSGSIKVDQKLAESNSYIIGFNFGLGLATAFATIYLIGTVILSIVNILAQ